MKLFAKLRWYVALLCAFAPAGPVDIALAQRPGAKTAAKPAPGTYDVSKDVSVQGTVLSYTENSQTPPIGARVLLQTAAGNVDVHLGDARIVRLAKLNLAQGASVRVIGQSRAVGQNTVFLARLVQVGSEVVAVRSDHGLPLAPNALFANKAVRASLQSNQGGAR